MNQVWSHMRAYARPRTCVAGLSYTVFLVTLPVMSKFDTKTMHIK